MWKQKLSEKRENKQKIGENSEETQNKL